LTLPGAQQQQTKGCYAANSGSLAQYENVFFNLYKSVERLTRTRRTERRISPTKSLTRQVALLRVFLLAMLAALRVLVVYCGDVFVVS
jgi:hypothetical protein